MIVIKIMGGLASQLHKYAIAKNLALKFNTELKVDLSWFDSISKLDTHRTYKLDFFNVTVEEASLQEIKMFKPAEIIYKIAKKINVFFKKDLIYFKTYYDKSRMPVEDYNNLPNNIYLEGEWIGHQYFSNIDDLLRDEFTLKEQYRGRVANFIDKHFKKNTTLISLHVRRGDFIHHPEASKLHCTCSSDYYQQAIEYLTNSLKDFHVLVFSDDLQWVKDNLSFLMHSRCIYIEDFEDYEEFYLMTQCHHHIIANSGFSWLSSWLNSDKNKIVISPKNWVYDNDLNQYIINSIKEKNMIFLDNL